MDLGPALFVVTVLLLLGLRAWRSRDVSEPPDAVRERPPRRSLDQVIAAPLARAVANAIGALLLLTVLSLFFSYSLGTGAGPPQLPLSRFA